MALHPATMIAACGILLLLAVSASAQGLANSFSTPITVPLGAGMRSNSTTLATNDPTVSGAAFAGTATPTQVHISPAGLNSITIMWATGNYTTGQGSLTPLDVSKTSSVVMYGTSASSLNLMGSGIVEIYNQIYNTSGPPAQGGLTALNYTSEYLHSVNITNLTPGTLYYYKVGDGSTFSAVYNFTSLTVPGTYAGAYPQRIITLADWGASQNSTVTRDHAVASAYANNTGTAPVVFYVGDYTYADTWYGNGTVSLPTSGFEGLGSSSWQPVWGLWQRMIESLVSHVPTLGCVGNHEIEQQDDANATIFASVQARWKVPSTASNSPQYYFYSQEFGPVHAIFLAVYADYTPGSPQWNWLAQDLLSINRTKTPWVIANMHNPLYTTDASYKEWEQMRISVETLMYNAGVDLFYYGHVHAYERTYPVYNYNNNECGTIHITIGDAGNTEGLSFLTSDKQNLEFEDLNGGCPNVTAGSRPSYVYSTNPSVNDPWTYYKRANTFQANGNTTGVGNPMGYCYAQQPLWSAYREPSFGHGTLDIINSTTALWQWHRNQDNNAVSADQVYIVRDIANCPNKMYPQTRSTVGGMLTTSSSASSPVSSAAAGKK